MIRSQLPSVTVSGMKHCSSELFVAPGSGGDMRSQLALTHDSAPGKRLFPRRAPYPDRECDRRAGNGSPGDIANELWDNDELCRLFNISKFIVDLKSEIIVRCHPDKEHPIGYTFRILASWCRTEPAA